jgi:hypothetical protein
VVKAPEGEEWDVKKVQEETGEEVKLANTFFDEMDDLFGLVSIRGVSSSFCLLTLTDFIVNVIVHVI